MLERTVTIALPEGLHARPAALLVQLAKSFQSSVQIVHGERRANAKSPIKLMLLGVNDGAAVRLEVDGPDEAEAIERIAGYLAGTEPAPTPHPPT